TKFVPWALFAADTAFLSRAYGLFGDLPLPFPGSVEVSNLTQILRAAAVSLGLVFGLRLVGAKFKDVVEELREHRPLLGVVCDAAVGGLVVAAAVRLIQSTAAMQQALLQIEAGGGSVHVPTSVLLGIVGFLGSVSLACGYFLNEPELDEAREHDQHLV